VGTVSSSMSATMQAIQAQILSMLAANAATIVAIVLAVILVDIAIDLVKSIVDEKITFWETERDLSASGYESAGWRDEEMMYELGDDEHEDNFVEGFAYDGDSYAFDDGKYVGSFDNYDIYLDEDFRQLDLFEKRS